MDSSGPSLPRRCNAVGLQDLGDAEGWGGEGEGLFLFELKGGTYHRTPLPPLPQARIEWVIDFKLVNPYILVRKNHRVAKWQNSGTLIASLIPREPIRLRYLPSLGYILDCHRKPGRLQLVAEFDEAVSRPVPPKSTLVIILALGSPLTKSFRIMSGVEVDWSPSATGQQVGILIRTPGRGDKEPAYVTRNDVRVATGDGISLDFVNLTPGLTLKRILFIDSLPDMSAVKSYLN